MILFFIGLAIWFVMMVQASFLALPGTAALAGFTLGLHFIREDKDGITPFLLEKVAGMKRWPAELPRLITVLNFILILIFLGAALSGREWGLQALAGAFFVDLVCHLVNSFIANEWAPATKNYILPFVICTGLTLFFGGFCWWVHLLGGLWFLILSGSCWIAYFQRPIRHRRMMR